MKKNIYLIFTVFLGLALLFNACSPEKFELGGAISKDQLLYSITQNPADPNMVILVSETPGLLPLWVTPAGRSTKLVDTIKLAFPGEYEFTYGVQSGGGFVQGDVVKITITTTNFDYIKDPLWVALTGGVGNEKVWIMDNGDYGLAPGALSYADPSTTVEFNNFTPNWEPDKMPPGSTDDNMGWGSTMTFSLNGGAFMTTNKLNEGGIQESGTFLLNVDNHTLSTSDVTILRPDNYITNADNWTNNVKILTLTDNQLRIAIFRTNSEGPWWLILNYISKVYADNYVPEDLPDPNFDFGYDQTEMLTIQKGAVKWTLSTDSPFDWATLDGALMNGWTSPADYVATGWAGYGPDYVASVAACNITFNLDGTVITTDNDGVVANGTYEIEDATNIITFTDITPNFKMGTWAVATTTDQNQWKILKIKETLAGVTDIWFGKRDPEKPEYMVFHFTAVTSGGGDATAAMKELLTNDDKQAWVFDQTVPFTWGRNDSHDLDYTDVVPDWAGYTSPVNIDGIILELSKDGSVVYTEDDGTVHNGIFALDIDKNRILFSQEVAPNFEICNGWVWCNTYTPGNYWELYKLEYSGDELVGIWFGKPTAGTPAEVTSGSERMCYHFVKQP